MEPVPPSWFKQRQCKLEAAGDNLYRVTAPQQIDAWVGLRPGEGGRWTAFLRTAAEGPDAAAAEGDFDRPEAAWEAAFELYRTHVIT